MASWRWPDAAGIGNPPHLQRERSQLVDPCTLVEPLSPEDKGVMDWPCVTNICIQEFPSAVTHPLKDNWREELAIYVAPLLWFSRWENSNVASIYCTSHIVEGLMTNHASKASPHLLHLIWLGELCCAGWPSSLPLHCKLFDQQWLSECQRCLLWASTGKQLSWFHGSICVAFAVATSGPARWWCPWRA